MDNNWKDILPEYGLIGILGKRGMGKTALGYYLCDLVHSQRGHNAVVYGPDVEVLQHLPDYFLIMSELAQVSNYPNHTIFIDEGSIPLHIRRAMSAEHILFDQAMSLCRHRNQLLIIAAHHTAKLDVLVIRDMDIIAFKQPSKIHTQMDRHVIQSLSLKSWEFFKGIPAESRKSASYVFWDDFDKEGSVDNDLPSFWSEEISKAIGLSTDVFMDDNFKQTFDEIFRFINQIRVECWKVDKELEANLGELNRLMVEHTYGNPLPTAEDMLAINAAMDKCVSRESGWSRKVNYAKNHLGLLTRQIKCDKLGNTIKGGA